MRHLQHQVYQLWPFIVIVAIVLRVVLRRRPRRRRRNKHSAEYRAYIGSPQWQEVRRKALARAGHRCEHRAGFGRCKARHGLQVHHKHYRDLYREWDGVRTHGECLEVLCVPHHAQEDTKRRRRLVQRGRVPAGIR